MARNDSYRQLRVVITPSTVGGAHHWSVMDLKSVKGVPRGDVIADGFEPSVQPFDEDSWREAAVMGLRAAYVAARRELLRRRE